MKKIRKIRILDLWLQLTCFASEDEEYVNLGFVAIISSP